MLRCSSNSCFLDSLLMVLLRNPSEFVRENLLGRDESDLSRELRSMQEHLQRDSAEITTSDAVRKLLPSSSAYESFDDGEAHECVEVLRQLLAHFECPDAMTTVTVCSIQCPRGCWYQRCRPVLRQEPPVWVVHCDQLRQCRGQPAHMDDLLTSCEHDTLDQPLELSEADLREVRECSCSGAPPLGFSSYRTRRTLCRIQEVRSDTLFVDIRRTYIDPATMREMRLMTPVSLSAELSAGGKTFELEGMVVHAMMHYVCIVREGDRWLLLDDQKPERPQSLSWRDIESNLSLLGHVVLVCYVSKKGPHLELNDGGGV